MHKTSEQVKKESEWALQMIEDIERHKSRGPLERQLEQLGLKDKGE